MKTKVMMIVAVLLLMGCATSTEPVPSRDLYIFAPDMNSWIHVPKGYCSENEGACSFEACKEFWRQFGYDMQKNGKLIPLKEI